MTPAEAADYLHVTPVTVYRWTQRGLLHPIHIGPTHRTVRYRTSEIRALVDGKVA
jgi:excisionase family DNA binding protein